MCDAAAREPGTVGKPAWPLRGNEGVSVAQAPLCAGMGERRYRRSAIPAQRSTDGVERPSLITDAPGFWRSGPTELPTLPDSRAAPPSGAHGKKGYLRSSLLVHALMSMSRSLAQNSSRAARSDAVRALVILRRGRPATLRTLAMRSSM